jgi:hypothetical protein
MQSSSLERKRRLWLGHAITVCPGGGGGGGGGEGSSLSVLLWIFMVAFLWIDLSSISFMMPRYVFWLRDIMLLSLAGFVGVSPSFCNLVVFVRVRAITSSHVGRGGLRN